MARILTPEEVRHITHRCGGPGDRAAAAVARRQLSVITGPQLQLAGLGRGAVARRCERAHLHRIHQGVFLWGAATPLPGARELAACLACGAGARVSHVSAGLLWGLVGARPDEVELSVAQRNCRSRPGLRVHRVGALLPRDIGDVRGVPVTSPARTLIDLAAGCDDGTLERALSEAFARRLVTDRALRAQFAPGRAGTARVRALLDALGGPRVTRSEAERLLLALCRRAGLALPRTNVRVAGFVVDACWPAHKLIVEIDGFAVHGHRVAFERDRRRDQELIAAGYRVMRITWRQLTSAPLTVAASIAAALARQ